MKSKSILGQLALFLSWMPFTSSALASDDLTVGQRAPDFKLQTHENAEFSLNSRKGQGWTVLYFYPKAGTPGCTTQACAFRDAVGVIRRQHAEVFGISTDDVEALQTFHRKHGLLFTLLSDPQAKVTEAYGVKMPLLNMAKRWTFILDPDLMVRQIDDDVDPALDAAKVAERLKQLQNQKQPLTSVSGN